MPVTADQLASIGITDPNVQQAYINFNPSSAGSSGSAQNGLSSAAVPSSGPGSGNLLNGATSNGLNTGFGMNIGTGQLALNGLSTLGNLWTAWNAQQLAQQSFNFNKTLASDNYANQAQAYNTQLGNIESERASMTNQTPAQAQAYVQQHSVKTTV